MKLENRTAIVTGGGQGIGRGIVLCLAEEGADIAIVEINPKTARSVAGEVESLGRKALPVVADATDAPSVEDAVSQVMSRFGGIDILVNNVGGTDSDASVVERAADAWDGFYRLSLKAHVIAAQTVIPHMKAQKSGKIINISSEAAWIATPQLMAYGAFKMADVSFTRSLALELAAENINVNCICPGVIWTPLWERLATALINSNPALEGTDPRTFFESQVVAGRPMGREETPEDIGRAVVFFASDDARNITGQSLNINGGNRMN